MSEATPSLGHRYFSAMGWQPHAFQTEAWNALEEGRSGLIEAPTGSGKTYSLAMGIFQKFTASPKPVSGLYAVWITPIRALASEIKLAAERVIAHQNLEFTVGMRNGDTGAAERTRQSKNPPHLLITTPESLHLLMAQKDWRKRFKHLQFVVVDEWHELLGSKRGVQVELALSVLRNACPGLQTWAISATIGNREEAMEVFFGMAQLQSALEHAEHPQAKHQLAVSSTHPVHIRASLSKEIRVETLIPEELETYPWSGHLGTDLLPQVGPLIRNSTSTLIFTNTRAQAEIWYQKLLQHYPELAGKIAMHHGSIDRSLRNWVEDALHEGTLQAVVCTSSLDLGVDFRPVETIIQIGGPKGVARFMQRAGRSGHRPGAPSTIYFLPTNSLELLEGAALKEAVRTQKLENRLPYIRSFDVLIQFLVTLAVGDGFFPDELEPLIQRTYSFQSMNREEWQWVLNFIRNGGESLQGYDDYHKVQVDESGRWVVTKRSIAMRHRLNIGTIVSDANLLVKYVKGGKIGHIEEWFVTQLSPGDVFWFAGRALELVRIRGMEVQVRKSNRKTGKIPAWMGGKMPLSAQLSDVLRTQVEHAVTGRLHCPELMAIEPLIALQKQKSELPTQGSWLMEAVETREGHHLFIFPFDGRLVHEALAGLLAYRLSLIKPQSFSLACSDYGLELLSDQPIDPQAILEQNLLTTDYLFDDLQSSVNASEMARRRFRDIASISGLVFQGYPGKPIKERHLQASSQLIFDVFRDYDPQNLLLQQAMDEVFIYQFELDRLRETMERMQREKAIIKHLSKPSPFSFHILVDRLRSRLSSEHIDDRIQRLKNQWKKD
jgi:ATP-dependent Lhr-like helicase